MTAADTLDRGREAYARQAWGEAYARLAAADREGPLGPEDLERLATAAYLVGRDAESADAWERAQQAFLAKGAVARAARCAFWLGFSLLFGGEPARSGGWLARARRLLDDARLDSVERGHLLVPGHSRPWPGETRPAPMPPSSRRPPSGNGSATPTCWPWPG